mmetsp:Transcript_34297/g.39047  ORF Transcript_34297/g.39047 Transcript_34297/m.39047 type:complete len:299 (-) Transcript_34297:277-1173(-)
MSSSIYSGVALKSPSGNNNHFQSDLQDVLTSNLLDKVSQISISSTSNNSWSAITTTCKKEDNNMVTRELSIVVKRPRFSLEDNDASNKVTNTLPHSKSVVSCNFVVSSPIRSRHKRKKLMPITPTKNPALVSSYLTPPSPNMVRRPQQKKLRSTNTPLIPCSPIVERSSNIPCFSPFSSTTYIQEPKEHNTPTARNNNKECSVTLPSTRKNWTCNGVYLNRNFAVESLSKSKMSPVPVSSMRKQRCQGKTLKMRSKFRTFPYVPYLPSNCRSSLKIDNNKVNKTRRKKSSHGNSFSFS